VFEIGDCGMVGAGVRIASICRSSASRVVVAGDGRW
jgi:hypothetical protein